MSSPEVQTWIPPTLLYQFSIECRRADVNWSPSGFELGPRHSLPVFSQLDGYRSFADVRVGWSPQGIWLDVRVRGKGHQPIGNPARPLASDCLQVWIDTRATQNVHRATRFCHWFLFVPCSAGPGSQPLATMLKINRAKENPTTFSYGPPRLAVDIQGDGYRLAGSIPDKCLTGWDPHEHQRIGFSYLVVDRELGYQSLAVGPETPISEDPSLWQELQLVGR